MNETSCQCQGDWPRKLWIWPLKMCMGLGQEPITKAIGSTIPNFTMFMGKTHQNIECLFLKKTLLTLTILSLNDRCAIQCRAIHLGILTRPQYWHANLNPYSNYILLVDRSPTSNLGNLPKVWTMAHIWFIPSPQFCTGSIYGFCATCQPTSVVSKHNDKI